MYRVLDLFCGAGGLSLGFTRTEDYEIVAAAEKNKEARETYTNNHNVPDRNMYEDVNDINYAELTERVGNIDIVIGGPPCQGFSNANRQKNNMISLNNKLVKQYVRAIRELNPTAFVMENVSMLKSDVHRFYVENGDEQDIQIYNIDTRDDNITLLNQQYMFEGALEIAQNIESIRLNIWDETIYYYVNVVFKRRNNAEKLEKVLEKHCKKLGQISQQLIALGDNPTIHAENIRVSNAIIGYYNKTISAEQVINEIETSIMIQRMLGKAKEIIEQNVICYDFNNDNGLTVTLRSFSVLDYILNVLRSDDYHYQINSGVLCAADFGVPQKRQRFVLIGINQNVCDNFEMPKGDVKDYFTVGQAIMDLIDVRTVTDISEDSGVKLTPKRRLNQLARTLRDTQILYNHIITATRENAQKRFNALHQGENFHSLSDDLKTNTYTDIARTQNTIYLKLDENQPSGTVVNVRKSMWIHPRLNRAVSVREAARLQSFPDSYRFYGTKDSQYQQVGNAVPPLLAQAIAEHLTTVLTENGFPPERE